MADICLYDLYGSCFQRYGQDGPAFSESGGSEG